MLKLNSLDNKIATFNFAFGALVVIGGIIGFAKAHSMSSIAAGMFFGNLLMLSVWGTPLLQKDESKQKTWGYYLSTLLSVVLLVFFVIRLIKTGKPMPGAVIILLSVISILSNVFVLNQKSIKSASS